MNLLKVTYSLSCGFIAQFIRALSQYRIGDEIVHVNTFIYSLRKTLLQIKKTCSLRQVRVIRPVITLRANKTRAALGGRGWGGGGRGGEPSGANDPPFWMSRKEMFPLTFRKKFISIISYQLFLSSKLITVFERVSAHRPPIERFHLTSELPCWCTLNKRIFMISFVWETNMAAMSIVFCVSWDCVKTLYSIKKIS